jgi:hypothetical protein
MSLQLRNSRMFHVKHSHEFSFQNAIIPLTDRKFE